MGESKEEIASPQSSCILLGGAVDSAKSDYEDAKKRTIDDGWLNNRMDEQQNRTSCRFCEVPIPHIARFCTLSCPQNVRAPWMWPPMCHFFYYWIAFSPEIDSIKDDKKLVTVTLLCVIVITLNWGTVPSYSIHNELYKIQLVRS